MSEPGNRRRIRFMMKHVKRAQTKKGDLRPITFFIVDDSQCKKERSMKRIERLNDHFSHADGKTVWSHCVVTAHVVSEGYSFAFDIRLYFREPYCQKHGLLFKSKNDIAIELIQSY
ncbi:MAG TPA: hypothetical protein VFK33_06845 [Bacillales bacterium]|nr:hypothetical protein [Bacillales bacterium]